MVAFYFETTCEHIRKDSVIQQPYSFWVNIMTIFLVMGSIFYFRMQNDVPYILLVSAITLMEGWHALCHARPFIFPSPHTPVDIVHALFLLVMVALVYFIRTHAGNKVCNNRFWRTVVILFVIDFFIWTEIRGVYMILSGIVIAAYLVGSVACKKGNLWFLNGLFLVAAILLCTEKRFCRASVFPLHVVIEMMLCLITLTTLRILVSCQMTRLPRS